MVGRTGINAYSSGRLPGDLQATTSATLDDNPATVWQPGLGSAAQVGTTLTYDLTAATTLTHLDLGVVADGRHSVPTSLTISAERVRAEPGGQVAGHRRQRGAGRGDHGPLVRSRRCGASSSSSPSPGSARRWRPTTTPPARSPCPWASPPSAGSAARRCRSPPPHCRGTARPACCPLTASRSTSPSSAPRRRPSTTTRCGWSPAGPTPRGSRSRAGTHVLQTAPGHSPTTGWNIDQLVLDSAAGGGAGVAATVTPSGEPSLAATQAGAAPTVTVQSVHIDTETAKVTGAAGSPFELVLGQSVNSGWRAVASPGPGAPAGAHSVDLGTPQLIDSFANGWAVTRSDLRRGGRARAGAEAGARSSSPWTGRPSARCGSRSGLSGVTLALCLVLGFLPERSRGWLRRRWRALGGRGVRRGRRGRRGAASGASAAAAASAAGRGVRRRQGRPEQPRPCPPTTTNPSSCSSAVSHPTGCGGGTSSSSAW